MKILLLLLSSSSSSSSLHHHRHHQWDVRERVLSENPFWSLSWTPKVKFCLSRQLRIFSSGGIIFYRIFPATTIMCLCAVPLKVTSLQYNHLNKTNSFSVAYGMYIFFSNFFKVYFNIIPQAKRRTSMWYVIFWCSNARLLCVLPVLYGPARECISVVDWGSAL